MPWHYLDWKRYSGHGSLQFIAEHLWSHGNRLLLVAFNWIIRARWADQNDLWLELIHEFTGPISVIHIHIITMKNYKSSSPHCCIDNNQSPPLLQTIYQLKTRSDSIYISWPCLFILKRTHRLFQGFSVEQHNLNQAPKSIWQSALSAPLKQKSVMASASTFSILHSNFLIECT